MQVITQISILPDVTILIFWVCDDLQQYGTVDRIVPYSRLVDSSNVSVTTL